MTPPPLETPMATDQLPALTTELTAAIDTGGGVVLINPVGDIVFYVADGKMRVERTGHECEACTSSNLRLAEAVAAAWNNRGAVLKTARHQCGKK